MDRLGEDLTLGSGFATLVFVDVVESVRLVQADEQAAVQRLHAFLKQAARQLVPAHQGRVLERQGDGMLLLFEHVRWALGCATSLHHAAGQESAQRPDQPTLSLRAGIHCSRFLTDGTAVFGAGVNLAARITALGGPGETLISEDVRDQLTTELDGEALDLGPCYLKHIDTPVRLFRFKAKGEGLPTSLQLAITTRIKTRPTLALLPFDWLDSREAGTEQPSRTIADVLGDQAIRMLARSPQLHVIAAASSMALRGRHIELNDVYRLLGADYIVRGTVKATSTGEKDRLELVLSLHKAGLGEPLFESTFRGRLQDALSLESELLGQVVNAVGARILKTEQRLAGGGTPLPSLASHTLYLNAVDLLHRFSTRDFEAARQMLEALSERAPRHPDPQAWLARWHVFRVLQGWSDDSQRDSQLALSHSERALDRDPSSSLALTMAGSVHAGVRRDPETAQNYYAQALEHNPNESLAWLMSGVAHGFLMRREAALAASETALGLSPIDPARHFYDSLGATAAVMAREYERAIALAQRAIRANAVHGSSYRALATAQVMTGQMDAARTTVKRLLAVEPNCTIQTYLARVGPPNPQNLEFADALRSAGLPDR